MPVSLTIKIVPFAFLTALNEETTHQIIRFYGADKRLAQFASWKEEPTVWAILAQPIADVIVRDSQSPVYKTVYVSLNDPIF